MSCMIQSTAMMFICQDVDDVFIFCVFSCVESKQHCVTTRFYIKHTTTHRFNHSVTESVMKSVHDDGRVDIFVKKPG